VGDWAWRAAPRRALAVAHIIESNALHAVTTW